MMDPTILLLPVSKTPVSGIGAFHLAFVVSCCFTDLYIYFPLIPLSLSLTLLSPLSLTQLFLSDFPVALLKRRRKRFRISWLFVNSSTRCSDTRIMDCHSRNSEIPLTCTTCFQWVRPSTLNFISFFCLLTKICVCRNSRVFHMLFAQPCD